jgi:hypothetical protein
VVGGADHPEEAVDGVVGQAAVAQLAQVPRQLVRGELSERVRLASAK